MSVAEQLVPVGEWRADGVHSSVRCEVTHMASKATSRSSVLD